MRCASCGNRWLAKPPADTPQVVELAPGRAAPPTPRMWPVAAPAEPRAGGSASLVGWLLGVLVILIVASAVIGRNEIVAGFPASAAIYQKLGLPVTLQLGLQFEGVVSRRLEEGGIAVLVVEGAIVNVTDQERPVPPIRVTLLDGGGRRLQQELFQAQEAQLDGGGKTSFSGRLVNPAEQARNFSVTFDRFWTAMRSSAAAAGRIAAARRGRLDPPLEPAQVAAQLAVGRGQQKAVEPAAVLDRADRMGRDPQPDALAERLAVHALLAQIGQEAPPGLVVGMADIVARHHPLAGQHAASRHR